MRNLVAIREPDNAIYLSRYPQEQEMNRQVLLRLSLISVGVLFLFELCIESCQPNESEHFRVLPEQSRTSGGTPKIESVVEGAYRADVGLGNGGRITTAADQNTSRDVRDEKRPLESTRIISGQLKVLDVNGTARIANSAHLKLGIRGDGSAITTEVRAGQWQAVVPRDATIFVQSIKESGERLAFESRYIEAVDTPIVIMAYSAITRGMRIMDATSHSTIQEVWLIPTNSLGGIEPVPSRKAEVTRKLQGGEGLKIELGLAGGEPIGEYWVGAEGYAWRLVDVLRAVESSLDVYLERESGIVVSIINCTRVENLLVGLSRRVDSSAEQLFECEVGGGPVVLSQGGLTKGAYVLRVYQRSGLSGVRGELLDSVRVDLDSDSWENVNFDGQAWRLEGRYGELEVCVLSEVGESVKGPVLKLRPLRNNSGKESDYSADLRRGRFSGEVDGKGWYAWKWPQLWEGEYVVEIQPHNYFDAIDVKAGGSERWCWDAINKSDVIVELQDGLGHSVGRGKEVIWYVRSNRVPETAVSPGGPCRAHSDTGLFYLTVPLGILGIKVSGSSDSDIVERVVGESSKHIVIILNTRVRLEVRFVSNGSDISMGVFDRCRLDLLGDGNRVLERGVGSGGLYWELAREGRVSISLYGGGDPGEASWGPSIIDLVRGRVNRVRYVISD